MVYSNKTTQTKLRIQESLLQLLKDSYFHNISVQEIADAARVDRSTFYRHYLDKFEIIERLENDILSGLVDYHNDGLNHEEASQIGDSNLFTYLAPWMDTLAILLGSRGLPETREHFGKVLHTCFQKELQKDPRYIPQNLEELLLQHKVSSFMGMLFYWMQHPEYNDHDIQTYFEQLTQDGVLGLLQTQ